VKVKLDKCSECGCEIKMSKQEKLQRKITVELLKTTFSALPTLEVTLEEAKFLCFKCFRKKVLGEVGPIAQQLLGQQQAESGKDQQIPEPGKVL